MPYRREAIFATPLLDWQLTTLTALEDAWSLEYEPEAPRFVLPLQGSFACRLNGAPFTCDPLHAVWLSPGQGYRLKQAKEGQQSWVLVVHADAASSRCVPASLAAQAALRMWFAAWRAGRIDALALEEHLVSLCDTALASARDTGTVPRSVERAKELLAAHPGIRHTVSDIARAAGCSPFHLTRLFRRHAGVSLHGYRQRLRMTAALQQLQGRGDDLTTIALDLGFAHHSHFTNAFRRAFGMAPAQMRRNLQARA